MSPDSLMEMCRLESQVLEEIFAGTLNAYVMKCEVRAHRELGEKYITGNLAINFKRDFAGMPLVYVATFFPTDFPSWTFKESHAKLCL
jgi:hypothetical protein